MRAWLLERPRPLAEEPLRLVTLPDPVPGAGEVVLQVEACGLCRTDIHVVQGEIPLPRLPVVPGHQAVGRVVARGSGARRFSEGDRAGVAWLHRACETCGPCRSGAENLCRASLFTGYHVDGGFAELVRAPEAYVYPLPEGEAAHLAPLLCAGIIGYRALRQADVTKGERVGLYGFGSSAHIALQVALRRGNRLFVVTRAERHRAMALRLGAEWTGDSAATPPEPLDRAVIFAPAGELIPAALKAVRWGGTVASACIHMSPIPPLDYTEHLFGERTLRSTTANTRADGAELLAMAPWLSTEVETFPFERLPDGLRAIAGDRVSASACVVFA